MTGKIRVEEVGQRRVFWTRFIWGLDLLAYLFLALAGVFALWFTPASIAEALRQPWVTQVWGGLLLSGGLVALLGRAMRVWAIELAANVLAAWGAFLFCVILIPAASVEIGWLGVLAFAFVAWLWTLRRYAELRIFTSEPTLDSFRKRLEAALRRRTDNIVPLEH